MEYAEPGGASPYQSCSFMQNEIENRRQVLNQLKKTQVEKLFCQAQNINVLSAVSYPIYS